MNSYIAKNIAQTHKQGGMYYFSFCVCVLKKKEENIDNFFF